MDSERRLLMRKARAYCPSYVTGIFTIGAADAAGAGFSIDRGMETTVCECRGMPTIRINGYQASAPVSWAVLKKFEGVIGKAGMVEISHKTSLPIGFGMGMSAAGAVSLSLALNELFGCGLPFASCVEMAHDSEVECGTGLSGADAAAIGGFLARKSTSHKPVKLPFEEKEIHFAHFSAIKTASIIRDPDWKKKVNAAGKVALGALFSDRSWDGFVSASREFALSCNLAAWCRNQMSANPRASMAMVGRTLFSDRKLKLPRGGFAGLKARTSRRGAELV